MVPLLQKRCRLAALFYAMKQHLNKKVTLSVSLNRGFCKTTIDANGLKQVEAIEFSAFILY